MLGRRVQWFSQRLSVERNQYCVARENRRSRTPDMTEWHLLMDFQ